MKKVAIGGGVLLVVVVVGVMLLLGNINGLVKKGVETAGPEILKASVTLASVDLSVDSVNSASGELKGLVVGNPKGYDSKYAFNLDRIKVEVDPESLTTDKIHVKEVVIDAPKIIFDGGFKKNNLTQLQANAQAFADSLIGGKKDTKESSSSAGKKIQIDHVIIKNGSVSVSMGILKGQALTVPLPTIELRDIGKKKDASISDAFGEVLGTINKAVLPAVQGGVGNLLKGVADVGKTISKTAGEGVDSVLGIFGK